jgi:hypothetical protein
MLRLNKINKNLLITIILKLFRLKVKLKIKIETLIDF